MRWSRIDFKKLTMTVKMRPSTTRPLHPLGVQQKLLRHAHIGTTMKYGNALMESKRDANGKN